MPNHIPNPLTNRARALREQSTEAEKKLWQCLRNRGVEHCKFRRQYPVGPYILDFACEEKRLGIELDGGQHNDPASQGKDTTRTQTLENTGWRILRFWNHEVMENIEGVLQVIAASLTRN